MGKRNSTSNRPPPHPQGFIFTFLPVCGGLCSWPPHGEATGEAQGARTAGALHRSPQGRAAETGRHTGGTAPAKHGSDSLQAGPQFPTCRRGFKAPSCSVAMEACTAWVGAPGGDAGGCRKKNAENTNGYESETQTMSTLVCLRRENGVTFVLHQLLTSFFPRRLDLRKGEDEHVSTRTPVLGHTFQHTWVVVLSFHKQEKKLINERKSEHHF